MTRSHGRCAKGERLRMGLPHGHRKTTTLVTGLRMTGMIAPMVLDGPDFNPIEKAFSRLKAMLRKAGEQTVSGLWGLIGKLVDIFQPDECANYFKSCGYEPE
jgi:hypothetical protein